MLRGGRLPKKRQPVIEERSDIIQVDHRYVYRGEEGSALLRRTLEKSQQLHIGRFGTTELAVVSRFLRNRSPSDRIPSELVENLCILSGFYPNDVDAATRFAYEFLCASETLGVLAIRWESFEAGFAEQDAEHATRLTPKSRLIGLESLSTPFLFRDRWTSALAGKRVLVVHPFADTIQKAYRQRSLIFPPGLELPNFRLEAIRPVQTIGRGWTAPPHASWFESLEKTQSDIIKHDFDIALIGAGAYGHFLASFCQSLGRVGIHLGGALQTIFGVSGRRWDDPTSPDYLGDKISCRWIYPSREETPDGYELVEGGCYWKAPE